MMFAGSSCVIPIGPEFTDPENYPPFVVSSSPAEGEVLSVATGSRQVTLRVGDQNIGDQLFIRWLIDYPAYSAASRIGRDDRAPTTGEAFRGPVAFVPDCRDHNIARELPEHRVTASISDREFLPQTGSVPSEARFDSVPEGAHRLRVTWTFKQLECP